MVDWRKYGVVYTPHKLAKFVSQLLIEEGNFSDMNESKVLDPACGEGALLDAMSACMGENGIYYGIDIDADIIEKNMRDFEGRVRFVSDDFILPKDTSDPVGYWKERIGAVHYIIANPPWSSDKLYEKEDLKKAGYILTEGQYDNYVLFIELCLKLVEENGVCVHLFYRILFLGVRISVYGKSCVKNIVFV
jgi:type I restriction-modification system DNA methylase subunit